MRPALIRLGGLRLLVQAIALGVVVVGAGVASAPADGADTLTPEPRTAWFGPELDWPNDSPGDYDSRLGADASLFATSVIYPLTLESEDLLEDLSATSAGAQAVGVVNVEPTKISQLTAEDADEFAAAVARVTTEDDSYLLLRYAPEMNGSWKPWGRRPVIYVQTFRVLADAVHGATDDAAMVWAPTYGAGYPYTKPINSEAVGDSIAAAEFDRRNVPFLDTDGNGKVTMADDPYGPYYPGDEYVDWVGLTILRFGLKPGLETNTRPNAGELEASLDEEFGYGDDRRRNSFYDRFARMPRQPFLLETAAVYNPQRRGPSEVAVKSSWLKQVVESVASRPLFRAVQWLEQSRFEDEVEDTVRWQIASDPALASVSRAVLEQGAIAFGPVEGIGEDPQIPKPSDDPAAEPEPVSEDDEALATPDEGIPAFLAGVLVTLAVVLVAAGVALQVRRRRMVPPWLR